MSASLILVCDAIGARHEFGPNGGVFGRSRKCDWVLPDQDRHLSSVHARILYQNDAFVLVDESTNGTFLEGQGAPVGRGKAVSLSPGMKLRAGPYQIRIESLRAGAAAQTNPFTTQPQKQAPAGTVPLRLDTLGASHAQTTSLDPLDHLGGGQPEALKPVASVQVPPATIPEPVYTTPSSTPQNMPQTQQDATRFQPAPHARQEPPVSTAPPVPQTGPGPGAFGGLPVAPPVAGLAAPAAPAVPPAAPAQTVSGSAFPASVLPGEPLPGNPAPGTGVSSPVTVPAAPLPAIAHPVATSGAAQPSADIIPEDFLAALTGSAPVPPAPPKSLPPDPAPGQSTAPVAGGAGQTPSAAIPDGIDFGTKAAASPVPVSPPLPRPAPTPVAAPAVPAAPASGASGSGTPLTPLEALKKRREQREAELAQKAKSRIQPPLPANPAPSPAAPATRTTAAAAVPGSPPAPARTTDPAVFQALLSGLGFANASIPDEEQAEIARAAGEMVRELANGLIALLNARKSLKTEFRMYETRIQPEENNPFKHFDVGELALDEMLFARKGGFLAPSDAAREAFKDLQNHSMTTVAATQRAMRLLFESLAPEALAGEEDDGGLRLKGLGSRRGKWETAKEKHDRLRADFDAVVRQTIAEAFSQIEEEQARQQSKAFWENRKK